MQLGQPLLIFATSLRGGGGVGGGGGEGGGISFDPSWSPSPVLLIRMLILAIITKQLSCSMTH